MRNNSHRNKKYESLAERCRQRMIRIALTEMQLQVTRHKMKVHESQDYIPGGKYEIEEFLNNAYMNRAEVALGMDIYKPVVPETQELPVIITLYGGGLVTGDRKSARNYSRELASRGYLVFAIEYRLVPHANVAEELDDVCSGMDLVGKKLVDFNVDFSRIFLTGSSAGGYLAIYVAAMKRSEKLQKAIGFEPSRVRFKAVGLDCGMIYTQLNDPIGQLLAEQFYGDKRDDNDFVRFMDPENPEVLNNLPPVFLNTCRGDFLNNYTLMFHKALKDAGKPTKLVYYGGKKLGHAFVGSCSGLKESQETIEKMLEWFEEQADIQREEKRRKEEQKAVSEK